MKFRVYIAQVNQTYVEVEAPNEDEAIEKAERKWKRETGPRVIGIEPEKEKP